MIQPTTLLTQLRSLRTFARISLLTALLLSMTACESKVPIKGLEAVFDGTRYRIQLELDKLTVFDHQLNRTVLSANARQFISAHTTDLTFSESHAAFTHEMNTSKSCTDAVIDKAEPTSHYFLLAGTFQSGNCPLRFSIRFSQDETQLRIIATTSAPQYNHITLTFDAPENEVLMGFGAQVSQLNFKGHNVPVWIQEQGIGRGEQPISLLVNASVKGAAGHNLSSYFSVPQVLSSAGYSVFLENTEFSQFDFRTDTRTQIHNYSSTLRARFTSCTELLDCVSTYTQYSGRMSTLPDWIQQGAVVGLQGGSERVRRHYHALKNSGTPISAVWLQDWVGRRMTLGGSASQLWWNWERDTKLYPDWDQLVGELERDNVRIMGYFNPFLVDASSKGELSRNLYQEALDNDFLVKDNSGDPYSIDITDFSAGLVDLSNPKAFAWLKNVIKQQVKRNRFSGWMADFGEALPTQAQLSNGENGLDYHNVYPQQWARLNAEVVEELGLQNDAVFFMRAGFTQSPGLAPLFWLGDQNTSWDHHDGLKSVVIGLINSGISGISLNHADIGGYTSLRRDVPMMARWLLPQELTVTANDSDTTSTQLGLYRPPNLLRRWIELSAFTPVFRTHEGLTPDINAQVYDDLPLREEFADNARLYKALAPYRRQLMQEAENRGWPLIRHPLLHYPQYPHFADMPTNDLQFMLGDSIMVAPMLTPKNERISRRVFLPEGDWIELSSGNRLKVGPRGQHLLLTPQWGHAPAFILDNTTSQTVIIPALRQAGFIQ